MCRYLSHLYGAHLQFYSAQDAGLIKKVKIFIFAIWCRWHLIFPQIPMILGNSQDSNVSEIPQIPSYFGNFPDPHAFG